jgi:hypothetical protein
MKSDGGTQYIGNGRGARATLCTYPTGINYTRLHDVTTQKTTTDITHLTCDISQRYFRAVDLTADILIITKLKPVLNFDIVFS